MPKFTYGEDKYLFEHEFVGTLLDDGDYTKFIEQCRQWIKDDKNAEDTLYLEQQRCNQEARDKLTGKKK